MEALKIIFIVSLVISCLLIGSTFLVCGLKNKTKGIKKTLQVTLGSILLGIAVLIIYYYLSGMIRNYINSHMPRIVIPLDDGIEV